MKILFEHANYFKYSQNKIFSQEIKDCLIARICFEEGDAINLAAILKEMEKINNLLKPKILVLFPFAHLSNRIMDSPSAKELLERITALLNQRGILTKSLPFGVDKGYELSVKEHKLNNIYREL